MVLPLRGNRSLTISDLCLDAPNGHFNFSIENTLMTKDEFERRPAHVNFYMRQHSARYGYLLTNTELVAVKCLDGNGRLAVSTAIPWTSGGVGQISVLLALWYLGVISLCILRGHFRPERRNNLALKTP